MLVILTLSEVEWGKIPRISLLLLHVLAFEVGLGFSPGNRGLAELGL
jgi:hypothetical protein